MSYTYEQKESPRVKTETTAKPTEAPARAFPS